MAWIYFLAAGQVDISPVFTLLAGVLVVAVLISLVAVKFRQSLLIGYMLCGVLIGNVGLEWMFGADAKTPLIANLSELGVILLMFTLGIEFSIAELQHAWRVAFIGGAAFNSTLIALVSSAMLYYGFPLPESLVLGVAVSLGSTAVAMKSFQNMAMHLHPAAQAGLSIALFQDLLVIGFFLIMPALYQGQGESVVPQLGLALLKAVAFFLISWFLGRHGVSKILHMVAKTKSRELFTLTVIALCASLAFIGHALNLSLALGAFTAGLVVSESIYSHRIMTDILPFKDLFLALFFISVGLFIDLGFIWDHFLWISICSVAILVVKLLCATTILKLLKSNLRTSLLAAASLASTGEFSLVLLQKASSYRVFDTFLEQSLLACSAITMVCVPTLMHLSLPFCKWLEQMGLLRVPHAVKASEMSVISIKDHAVICGYGPVGKALNEALKRCGVSTLIMELNVETVKQLKKEGQPVLFADATHGEALDLAGIPRARIVAYTFPDVELTAKSIPLVRERNSAITIFGRAKFEPEALILTAMDVNVIYDERESAVAMVRSAMSSYERLDINAEDVVEHVFA